MAAPYCITKEVKYSASTLAASPPESLTTGTDGFEAAILEIVLALERRDTLVILVAEDEQQVVADARIVVLDELFDFEIARHDADRDLQESHGGFRFEVHDERRIERDVFGRQQLLLLRAFLLRLRIFLVAHRLNAAKPPPPSTSSNTTAMIRPFLPPFLAGAFFCAFFDDFVCTGWAMESSRENGVATGFIVQRACHVPKRERRHAMRQ
jgi:hypothetical protein